MQSPPGLRAAKASALLFTEHDMDIVFGADRVIVLDRGKIPPKARLIRSRRSARAGGLPGRGRVNGWWPPFRQSVNQRRTTINPGTWPKR
jgi:energy-coupling factor transporter ATP-binding protein EcfA2